jgi:hypothetical protein
LTAAAVLFRAIREDGRPSCPARSDIFGPDYFCTTRCYASSSTTGF